MTDHGAPVRLGTEKALVRIGDITCTQTAVITPLGRHPVSGVRWRVVDLALADPSPRLADRLTGRLTGRRLPRHRGRVTGELQVVVESDSWQHRCVIPVTSLAQVTDIYAQVLRARALSGLDQRDGGDGGDGGDGAHLAAPTRR